jgi:adenosylhomocysteine nucleosidase
MTTDPLLFDDPCVLFALRRESAPFLRLFPVQQRFGGAPCRARFCGPSWLTVLVVETGVGTDAASRALDWVLGSPRLDNVPYRPKVVLSAGFCGALKPGYGVGDVVVADEVVVEGKSWPVPWPGELAAGDWQPPLHHDRLLCVPHLVGEVSEKRALAERHGAGVVDMESAAVAQACSRAGVPFGCVRAVSDDCDTPLSPALTACLSGGRVDPLRLLAATARSPALVPQMWRLARQTCHAARQLALALGELLTLTLPWTEEGERGASAP